MERSVEWGGGGGRAGLNGEKIFLAFLGVSGGMLPQTILKIKCLRLAKTHSPRYFN